MCNSYICISTTTTTIIITFALLWLLNFKILQISINNREHEKEFIPIPYTGLWKRRHGGWFKNFIWCGTKPTSYLSESSQKVVTCDVQEIHPRAIVLINYIGVFSFSILSVGHKMQKLDLIFK